MRNPTMNEDISLALEARSEAAAAAGEPEAA
jgi:hypothetical protein